MGFIKSSNNRTCWQPERGHRAAVLQSKLCLLPFHHSTSLSGCPPKHSKVWWCADGFRTWTPALLMKHVVPSFLVTAAPAQLFLQRWASRLKSSAGAYQLYLYEVERTKGWSVDIAIYSFMDKCALLSLHSKREMIVKVVRVKNSPYVVLKNIS